MKITIQTVNFKNSKKLTDFIKSKVGKLFTQSPGVIRADVSLKEEMLNGINKKCCSIYISHTGENKFVNKNAESHEESVLLATEAMRKILRRKKTKMVNMRNDNRD